MQPERSASRNDEIGITREVAAILAAVPDAMIAIDGDDRLLALNGAAQTLFPEVKIGAALARNLRSPDVLDAVASARTSGITARATWYERAPVERFFEISASLAGTGGFRGLVILHLREISEARRFERMRVDFVTNASHELRTPLASLLGFIETLQGPARNDEVARARFLTIMRDQARRMARLVDDLLSLSRIEQHLHLQPRERVNTSALVRHVGDTLTPLARENGVRLEIDAAEQLHVAGDRDELLRVVENLMENAIKYGTSDEREKIVAVEVKRAKAEARITVRDYGDGIAPEHIPRLTERFYRVDAGQSRAKGGTGLGLAIVKHVIARHRGRLKIQSVRGQGSTFEVSLPLHRGESETA